MIAGLDHGHFAADSFDNPGRFVAEHGGRADVVPGEYRAEGLVARLRGEIRPGDRVATLMWNHAEHLEAYLGVPLAGASLAPGFLSAMYWTIEAASVRVWPSSSVSAGT